ncbi:hypothetical protein LSM04_007091 [Trypanosoma melophagium]|uniref:uncharacterized protein n=1 Tax=Trypanosoma melophagium TaxID=715481 RepID=UPI00351A038E|nr:hypothetical protein LSM04_005097 [Trypanosoma melophagium]KAH9584000.1 hypothetical protein LSM04_007091 [Trypanosoma melophagium]
MPPVHRSVHYCLQRQQSAYSERSIRSSDTPSGGANGGGGGNNNVGGDGCATVAPIALAAVVLMVITPML